MIPTQNQTTEETTCATRIVNECRTCKHWQVWHWDEPSSPGLCRVHLPEDAEITAPSESCRQYKLRCPECNGMGATPIHVCHGDDEVCRRKCPDFDQCQFCNATGYIDNISKECAKIKCDFWAITNKGTTHGCVNAPCYIPLTGETNPCVT